MNKLIKNKKRIMLLLVFLFIIHYSLFIIPFSAIAQVKLETGLPNIPGGQLPAGQELPSYIKYLFIFGLGLITILALGQMTLGGILYILAAGNAAKVEDAKDHIFQALLGLGMILVSYLFLRIINPDLVNLRNPGLTPKSFNFPEKIITGPAADKAKYDDIIKAPEGTIFIPSSGMGSISREKDTITDCAPSGDTYTCSTRKISDLEKIKPSEPLFKEPIIAP